MVAVVSGSGLGLFGSSVAALGGVGASGNAAAGRGNDRIYVNTANGNLIVQSQDERLSALGLDLNLVRTYNSQGVMDDDNWNPWRLGVHQRVYNPTGTINTAGSRVTKMFGDGREVTYEYDTGRGAYISTDGDGAHDTLTNSGGTWTWTDGSSRNTETYNSAGQLTHSRDVDGNTITYGYTGNRLTQITDASGQITYLDYTNDNLTSIRVVSDGQTQTLTRYYYDSSNRLRQVVLDLTPADNVVSLVDANSDGLYEAVNGQTYVTTYTYDGVSDRITSITQGDGSSVSFTYQQLNGQYRVHTFTDAENRTTTLTYSQAVGGAGGSNAAADPDAISTTRTETHNLDQDQLTSVAGSGSWSAAQLLETTNGANASSPSIVFDASGNGYATWVFNGDIYVRRYDAATAQWTAAVRLDSTTVLSGAPQLAVDRSTGKVVLAWMQSTGVAISNYDAVTDTWSAVELVVSTGASTISKDFFSVALAGDYVAITWLQSDGQRHNLRAVVGHNGVWSSSMLLENSTQTASLPQVGIDASGNALVTWRQSDGTAERVYYSRWTDASQSFTTAAELDSGSSATERPRLSFDAQGNAFAMWGESSGLKVRRFDATSGTWSTVTSIQSATISTWDLSVDAQGNALVGWVQLDGSINSAYARRFDAATGTWGTVTALENSTAQVSTSKIAVAIAGQNAVVGWLQSNGTADDLYAANLSGSTWSTPQVLDSRTNPAMSQFAAVDLGGNAALVWEQVDSTNARSIWQARYTSPASY
ncbi:MAG TPA: hypothetical protein VNR40_00165, partial [Steroidobacter sp.]|nr:hypothetical protein [Steroidobacter sp.]